MPETGKPVPGTLDPRGRWVELDPKARSPRRKSQAFRPAMPLNDRRLFCPSRDPGDAMARPAAARGSKNVTW